MTDREFDDNFSRAGLTSQKLGGTPANWNAPGTQAVFAACPDFAILAFRGTEGDDPEDRLTDAAITPVPSPDLSLFGGLVHRGFRKALNQIWDSVLDAVGTYRQEHPHSEICLTGHSLGGALALLAFSRLKDEGVSLYTFGCPRVGNSLFRDLVISNPRRGIYRFVNGNDAVAHVPPESLFYRQTPHTCCQIMPDGSIEESVADSFKGDLKAIGLLFTALPASFKHGNLDQTPAPWDLVDHSPARYCTRLWDCI